MRSIYSRASLVAAALAVLALPGIAAAQMTRGTITGTVTDSSGGVLPGVTVTITNQATGVVRTTVSNEEGIYRAPAVEPGSYTVRVELEGFQPLERKGVDVQSNDIVTLNAKLDVATLSETVQVTAESGQVTLNKTNPTLGLSASNRQAVELPLSGNRDINQLAKLSPNVFDAPGSTGISANGSRARNNNFTIDGSDNNDVSVTLSTTQLPPEVVQEFQVQTNAYSVEFGRNSGAQINVITRSGTNALKGDVWEYYRGSELNARDNLEKAAGQAEPTRFNRNQMGAGVGGPILRNRTFFFGTYQIDRNNSAPGAGTTVRIPTQAGFAALQGAPLGANQSAASRQAVLQRLGFLQDIYAKNLAYRNFQNVTVNGVPVETAQVNVPIATPFEYQFAMGRVDHQLSASDNLTGRFTYNKRDDTNVFSNCAFGDVFCGNQNIVDMNAAMAYTRIFSPQVLNEARFSFVRRDLQFPENDPTSPTAGISGFFTVGGASSSPQGRVQNSYQFNDTLTWQRGRQAIKFGTDVRYIQLDNTSGFDSKGTFTFNNLQDYMNNFAIQFVQALQVASFDARQWSTSFFVQDDVKVTPNFTINGGVRYELSTVPLGFFGATDAESLGALVPGPAKKDTNNVAPRVGVSWTPTPESGFLRTLFGDARSVISGGFGISYDVLFYNILTVNANNYPRVFSGRVDNAQDVYPNVTAVGGSPVFNPLAGYVNTPEDAQSPRSNFWSLRMQREVADTYIVEVGYTGSIGRNGINQLQANPASLTPGQIATVNATLNVNSIPATQARRDYPQYGSRTLIATTAKSEYHAGYVRVDRRFRNNLQFGASYTFSKNMSDNDESLAVAGLANGSPQVPQDYKDIESEWSLSAFDRPHRFVANWIYQVPSYDNRALDVVLGGWQLSGVYTAQAGQPFTIVTGVDSNGNGTATGDRPNYNPNGTLVPDPNTGNLRTFTTSNMFLVPRGTNGLPLAFSLGNGDLGRNTLRAAAWFRWDLTVSKRFRTVSNQALTIRADFLNAFNQDNYGIPINSMNNVSFGQNTNNWGNRSVTLSAKYSF